MVRASALSLPATASTSVKTMPWDGEVTVKAASHAVPAATVRETVPPAICVPAKSRAHQFSVTDRSAAAPLTTWALSVMVCPAALYRLKGWSVQTSMPSGRRFARAPAPRGRMVPSTMSASVTAVVVPVAVPGAWTQVALVYEGVVADRQTKAVASGQVSV